jgi:hypothetical protein
MTKSRCRTIAVAAAALLALAAAAAAGAASAHCEKPRLLLILDRSVSMVTGLVPEGVTRWEAAGEAVSSITTAFEDRIEFALMVFPYPDACSPGSVVVDYGPGAPEAIAAYLAAPVPARGNWTPMAQSLEAARWTPPGCSRAPG